MIISDFITPSPDDDLMQDAEPLHLNGATSEAFKVRIDGRWLFMKRLRPEFSHDPRYRAMFQKEYELGSNLHHQHLAGYVDYNESSESPYILMEYVEGRTLTDILASDPDYFSSEHTLHRFLSQLLQVLQYLHTQRIVHLDIKPDNLMLARVSGDLYLLDLGFCYADAYGNALGRNDYFSAPEQLSNPDAIDARTDLFAVGRLIEYIASHTTGHKLPARISRIAARCQQPDKNRRFASAQEALSELQSHRDGFMSPRFLGFLIAIVILVLSATGLLLLSRSRGADLPVVGSEFSVTFHHREFFMRIISTDSLTCEVMPHPEGPKRYEQIVELPEEVTYQGRHYRVIGIADQAFAHCLQLQHIRLPHTIAYIGQAAFDECKSLLSINLPEGLTTISDEMLLNCVSLPSLRLPSTLKTISSHAFIGDSSLTRLQIPEGVTWIGPNAFTSAAVREVELPSTLQGIDEGAFWACRSLQRITLPAGLVTLGDHLFWHCDSLLEVRALMPEPLPVSDIFRDTFALPRRLLVPRESLEAYRQAEHWRDFPVIEAL